MDLPSKATARSKWRSSQSHKPGPHHHKPVTSESNKRSKAGLENNYDRYEEEEVDARPGQTRQSQGEDLAALLRDAEGVQQAARHRTQMSAEPEIELLESALQGQEPKGLILDMETLAKALSFIPLHQVLGLDPSFFPVEPPEPAMPADMLPPASSPTAELEAGADARVSSSDGLSSSHMANHSKRITSTSDGSLPVSQPTAAPAAELHTARPSSLADGIEPGKMQGRRGPTRDRPPHPTLDRASSGVMPAGKATVPSRSNPSSTVQQPVPYKPTSSAATSSQSSGGSSASQVQQPIRPQPASSARASGVTTGSSNTGMAQHAALGSSGGGLGMSNTRSVAAKPSDDAAAAAEDDDELDALLGMSSVAGSKSERPQISSSKHDASDDDDLDALLGLGGDEVLKVAKPQKGSKAPSGSRQQPDDDSLESFLDSL